MAEIVQGATTTLLPGRDRYTTTRLGGLMAYAEMFVAPKVISPVEEKEESIVDEVTRAPIQYTEIFTADDTRGVVERLSHLGRMGRDPDYLRQSLGFRADPVTQQHTTPSYHHVEHWSVVKKMQSWYRRTKYTIQDYWWMYGD